MQATDLGKLLKNAKENRGIEFTAEWLKDEIFRQPKAFVEMFISIYESEIENAK